MMKTGYFVNKRHNDSENEHKGRTDCRADYHHIGILNVGDVGGKPCHERRGREAVDILEREALHRMKHIAPQIPRKAAGRPRAGNARRGAEAERENSQKRNDSTVPIYAVYIKAALRGAEAVDELGDYHRYYTLYDNLAGDEKGREN